MKDYYKDFYEKVYETELGKNWLQKQESDLKKSLWQRFLSYFSIEKFRIRFFKGNFKKIKSKKQLKILDVGCGAGLLDIKKYGNITGVDINLKACAKARNIYDQAVCSNALKMPFEGLSFDVIISSDFMGHILNKDKGKLLSEFFRVLKPGGVMMHIIETDGNNLFFRYAKKDGVLFNKHFVERIGGHHGLEKPAELRKRLERAGFKQIKIIKLVQSIWPIQEYAYMFDNEYIHKSFLIKIIVKFSKFCIRHKKIESIVNVLLYLPDLIIKSFTNLNAAQGVGLVCRKER